MSFESEVSHEAFEQFAVDGTLAGDPVRVILDRSVSYIDEDGGIRDRIVQASFRRDQVSASLAHGTELVADGETWLIARRETDDGIIVVFEVKPQGEVED